MLETLYCIALRTVRVNDSRNLLSVWTHTHGRVSVAMPAGNGREARRRRALTTPLSMFEAVADVRPDKDIITVRDLMPLPQSPTMTLSVTRTAGASFIAEALDLLLRQTTPDEALTAFLFDAVTYYGEAAPRAAANFHVAFLCHLAQYLGIAPDISEAGPTSMFDLREGRFIKSAPLHGDYLSTVDTRAFLALIRLPLRRCGMIIIPRYERRRALDIILQYYSMHLTSLESLKSIEILREIFD